jgi:hypothetical protein
MKKPVAKLDASISLSLLDRLTVDDIEKRERAKATQIDNAKVLGEVQGYAQEPGL